MRVIRNRCYGRRHLTQILLDCTQSFERNGAPKTKELHERIWPGTLTRPLFYGYRRIFIMKTR